MLASMKAKARVLHLLASLEGSGSQNSSFKDKLMGEIPGAYTQAFCFEEFMDNDAKSDDEVETLR